MAFGKRTNLWILFLILLGTVNVMAQGNSIGAIKGTVVEDSTGLPIQYVNVVLRNKSNSELVAWKTTDKTGKFQFTHVPNGEYFLACNLTGFKKKQTQPFAIDSLQESFDIGSIRLMVKIVQLAEMVVTGEKTLLDASFDRKVYNIDQDIMAKAGSASDALQNVPSVQVDIDGNVSLRGSPDVMIMINGKASPLMKRNSATVLQQMPAGSIEKIEVITNPSSKYDPEGTSGIINIVLKKNTTLGINGSVGANAGNQDRYNGTVRFNYNPGALNLFGSYALRKDHRTRTNNDDQSLRGTGDTLTYYHEALVTSFRPLAHIATFGFDYRIDSTDQFGLSGNFFSNGSTRTEVASIEKQDSAGTATGFYQRHRIDYDAEKEYGGTAFWEHSFPKEDHTVRLELNTTRAPESEDNHYTNIYTLPAIANTYDNTLIKNSDNTTQLTIEYSNPLTKESKLEAGYAGEFVHSDLDYSAWNFDPVQQQFVTDVTKTNHFLFDGATHALYATYTRSLGLFGLMAGLRTESSAAKPNLVTLDSSLSRILYNLYPSLHLSYKATPQAELQLSYSRRTRRPESDDLNPFPEYRDPRDVEAGNPRLLPEFIHSLELGCQWQTKPVTVFPSLYYRYTSNRFTSVTKALNDSVLFTTRQNLSYDQSGGLEIVVSAALGKLFSAHLNANAFAEQIDASNLGYSDKKSVISWSGTLTADVTLAKATRMQINTKYQSPRLTPQGHSSPSYVFNMGFRQGLFRDKVSLTLTVSDLFKTMKRQYTLDTPTLSQTVVNRRDSRTAYLGVTYNFGAQTRKQKEEQLKYDENL